MKKSCTSGGVDLINSIVQVMIQFSGLFGILRKNVQTKPKSNAKKKHVKVSPIVIPKPFRTMGRASRNVSQFQ